MTEPQAWVLIGVFAAAMGTMITLVLMTMNAKFAMVLQRLDHLDADVNALMQHTFGIDRS